MSEFGVVRVSELGVILADFGVIFEHFEKNFQKVFRFGREKGLLIDGRKQQKVPLTRGFTKGMGDNKY